MVYNVGRQLGLAFATAMGCPIAAIIFYGFTRDAAIHAAITTPIIFFGAIAFAVLFERIRSRKSQ